MKTYITILATISIIFSLKAQTTILEEGFESGTFPPLGWTTFRGTDNNGTENDWITITDSNSGTTAAFSRYSENGIGLAEDWLVSSQIDLTNSTNTSLSFYSKEQYGTTYMSQYDIRVSTNSQTTHSDFTTVATYGDFPLDYEEIIIDLSTYDGQQIYLAFVHIDEWQDNWFLDDITIAGNLGCAISSSTSQGLSGNQFYGQTFTAECNGFLEFVQINLLPNQSATVTGSKLKISEGNVIGFADYTQDFEDIEINDGNHLRIYLNGEFPVIEGNQYAFETYVANLNVSIELTDVYSGGNLLMGHATFATSELGFKVGISTESVLNVPSNFKEKLTLFPNPASDYISISNLDFEKNYVIYNVLGKEVASDILVPKSQILVTHLEKGVYFLKLEGSSALKFIKN